MESTAPNSGTSTQKGRRIPRVIKDSVGSTCNHKDTEEEFKVTVAKEIIFDAPKMSKPQAARIRMLSGDLQRPKIKKVSRVNTNNSMSDRQSYMVQKVNKHANSSGKPVRINTDIPIETFDLKRLEIRHQSPKTRNETPSFVSTHRLNT